MDTSTHTSIKQLALRILQPFIRMLLRNGMTCQEFCELARQAYVECALTEPAGAGKKVTDARAAALTGLNRKEVRRLRQLIEASATESSPTPPARGERVVSGWQRDHDFVDETGQPIALPFAGPLSFSELVRRYSGDIPPRAMLEELKRVGVASEQEDAVRLEKEGYIPSGDPKHLFDIASRDVAALLATVDHNLVASTQAEISPVLQRTLRYSRIPRAILPEWHALAQRESEALLNRLNHWLAQHDGDVRGQPDQVSEPVTTGLGLFYFDDTTPTSGA